MSNETGIKLKVVQVTPYLANVWLKNNKVNRRLDRKAVARYAHKHRPFETEKVGS